MIARFATSPSPMTGLLVEHVHGAMTRVGVSETAFPHRRAGYNFLVVSEWVDPADTARNIAWAREAYDAMQPHCAPGRYVNYLEKDEGPDAVRAAYGPNYARLRALKTK